MTASFVPHGAWVLDESGGFSGPVDVTVVRGRIAAVERNAGRPVPVVPETTTSTG